MGAFITFEAESRKNPLYVLFMYLLYIILGTFMISYVNQFSVDESFYWGCYSWHCLSQLYFG